MLGCFTIVALLWADTGCVSLVVPALFFEHYSSVGFVHLCSTFVLSLSFGCCCLRIRPHTHFSLSYNIIPLFPDRIRWHYPQRTRAVVLQLTYFTLWSRGLVCHLNVCWHHHWPHLRREKCLQRALWRDQHYCYTYCNSSRARVMRVISYVYVAHLFIIALASSSAPSLLSVKRLTHVVRLLCRL